MTPFVENGSSLTIIWYDDKDRGRMINMIESWIQYEPLRKEEVLEKLERIYPDRFSDILRCVNYVFEGKEKDGLIMRGDM